MLVEVKTKNGEQLVSARELHEKLEVKSNFTTWIKRRIKKYGFVENIDFVLVFQKRNTNNLKNPEVKATDYILKLNMAKELSMIENNEIGRKIRRYFIECESKLKLVLEDKVKKLKLETKIKKLENKEKFSKKELSLAFQNAYRLIEVSDQINNDIKEIEKLVESINQKQKYVAMYSDNMKFFTSGKYDGKVYKGNKLAKVNAKLIVPKYDIEEKVYSMGY